MKVVRIYEIKRGVYEVVYTIKTEGNSHFYHAIPAPDEITAFVKGLEFAQKDEIEVIENKLDDLDFIKSTMPSADIDKEIKKLRKLLTGVNKSGGGNEEQG